MLTEEEVLKLCPIFAFTNRINVFLKDAKWWKNRVTIGVLELVSQMEISVQLSSFSKKTGLTIDEIVYSVGLNHESARSIIRDDLGFSKDSTLYLLSSLDKKKHPFVNLSEATGPLCREGRRFS